MGIVQSREVLNGTWAIQGIFFMERVVRHWIRVQGWSQHPWKGSVDVWMWHLGLWLVVTMGVLLVGGWPG